MEWTEERRTVERVEGDTGADGLHRRRVDHVLVEILEAVVLLAAGVQRRRRRGRRRCRSRRCHVEATWIEATCIQ